MHSKLLRNVERVVVHGDCPDGMASAKLLYDALKVEPEFVKHGSEKYEQLDATEGMLFCDIAPPVNRWQEFRYQGAIVLDHHKAVEDIVKAFGERGVFADEAKDPGVSGAVLAFNEVWYPYYTEVWYPYYTANPMDKCEEDARMFAKLAGIRDTWQKDNNLWKSSCHQAAALTFYSWKHWKSLHGFCMDEEMKVGEMIFENRLSRSKQCAKEAVIFEDCGFKVGVFNDPNRFTSDVADLLRDQGCNVIAGFSYFKAKDNINSPNIYYSLRSDDSFNVGEFAESLGGGGHTLSAGFTEEVEDNDINPFTAFREIFEDYMSYRSHE